jgi:hypothetical protein
MQRIAGLSLHIPVQGVLVDERAARFDEYLAPVDLTGWINAGRGGFRDRRGFGPWGAGLAFDEALALEGEDHLVDGGECDAEVSLHVGLGGGVC